MMLMDETRKIGVGITGIGVLFLFLGMMFLFDTALLAIGNLMFIGGVVLVIGIQNTTMFFFKRYRGALCFLGGMILVLFGYSILGMGIEIFGIFNLFGNFFPMIWSAVQAMPCFAFLGKIKFFQKLFDIVPGLPTYTE